MAFGNVAGRAGFVLDLDKSALDSGLPAAERQFTQSVNRMTASAQQMTATGLYSPQQVNLAEKYGLSDLISQNDQLEQSLARTNEQIGELEAGGGRAGTSIGGVAARAGLAAVAINTLYQGSQRAAEALDVTGAAAVTTEGKVRNLGAALLHGDLVAGFEALAAQPKTLEDLGLDAFEAANNLDKLKVASDAFGGSATTIYEEALKAAEGVRELDAASAGLLRTTIGLRDAQGGQILPGAGFGALPTGAPIPSFGTPITRRAPSDIEAQRLREAQRAGDDQAELAVAQEIARRARRRVEIVQREGPLLVKRREEEQDALDRVDAISDRIAANRAAARERRRAEAERLRREQEAEAERRRAEAERRQAAAARALRERLSTREQNLRNAYEAALETPGMRDDQRRFAALRSFFQAEGRDPRLTAGERAGYRGELGALRRDRREDIATAREAANEETRDHLKAQEEVLKNRVAAAELTEKNKKDDLKALRALRDFYRRSARDEKDVYSEIEQIQFRGDATATQKKINDVLSGKTAAAAAAAGDPGAVMQGFLRQQHSFFTSMISQFLGGSGAGNALQTHALEQFTLQGNAHLADIARTNRMIVGPSGRRELDEAVLG